MSRPVNYLRFDTSPPVKPPPPAGSADLQYDPDADELKLQTPDGTSTSLGGSLDATADGYANKDTPLKGGADDGSLTIGSITAKGETLAVVSAKIASDANKKADLGYVSGIGPFLQLQNGATAGILLQTTNIAGGSRNHEAPNANGTYALTSQTDGSITEEDLTFASAYADDAAAAAGGISVGSIYRKTDGTVAWRQA